MNNEEHIICHECRYKYLDKNLGIKCPKCGSTEKTISLENNASMGLTDSFELIGTDRNTNRAALFESSDKETNRSTIDKLIDDFIDSGNSKNIDEHFDPLIKNFNDKWKNKITCYRGVNTKHRDKFQTNQISPTEKEYTKDNRYSKKGERAFYLIDNPKYIKDEIDPDNWIEQKYNIVPEVHELRLANVSSLNVELHNDIACFFQISELGKSSGKSDYFISQYIANLFKKYHWDGLIIPGVRGGATQKKPK